MDRLEFQLLRLHTLGAMLKQVIQHPLLLAYNREEHLFLVQLMKLCLTQERQLHTIIQKQ